MDWLDLLAVQGTLKSLLQHHSSKASILQCSDFFRVQLSHPYMTTGKTIALTRRTFVGKVMSLLFNMLSRLVITFLPRSTCLLISWLQSLMTVTSSFTDMAGNIPSLYAFSSGHVWMWELDYKEVWALKNWCFCTVVLEKTLKSPLDCKEIQPVHSKWDLSWGFFGRNDAKAETPVLWLPHAKSWLIGKDFDAGRDLGKEKGTTEDEMAGWHHWLDGRVFEWTPGVGGEQGGLACCGSWGRKESDTTEPTELNWTEIGMDVIQQPPCGPNLLFFFFVSLCLS